MKLEIIMVGKLEKSQIYRKVNNALLNTQWVKEEIKRGNSNLEQMKLETQHTGKSNPKGKAYCDKCLH